MCRKISSTSSYNIHKELTLKKMLNTDDKSPSWWFDESSKSHDGKLIEWPIDSQICLEIRERFEKSLRPTFISQKCPYLISKIYSVQNKYLWRCYQSQREIHAEALGIYLYFVYVIYLFIYSSKYLFCFVNAFQEKVS